MSNSAVGNEVRDHKGVWCVLVAGGSGTRFGRPKQYCDLAGERVIDRSVSVAASVCSGTVLVVPDADVDTERARFAHSEHAMVVVAGGETRSDSVRSGLSAVPPAAEIVLVHDAARPLATRELYRRVIDAVRSGASAVVPVVTPVDTLRSVDGGPVERDSIRSVQTPQGFAVEVLREAHSGKSEATDDATLAEATGYPVTLVDGERTNLKITEPADLVIAEALVARLPKK